MQGLYLGLGSALSHPPTSSLAHRGPGLEEGGPGLEAEAGALGFHLDFATSLLGNLGQVPQPLQPVESTPAALPAPLSQASGGDKGEQSPSPIQMLH